MEVIKYQAITEEILNRVTLKLLGSEGCVILGLWYNCGLPINAMHSAAVVAGLSVLVKMKLVCHEADQVTSVFQPNLNT